MSCMRLGEMHRKKVRREVGQIPLGHKVTDRSKVAKILALRGFKEWKRRKQKKKKTSVLYINEYIGKQKAVPERLSVYENPRHQPNFVITLGINQR